MELKWVPHTIIDRVKYRFNRTFMELKLMKRTKDDTISLSFNRTFMELKSGRFSLYSTYNNVLIVPLWN